MDMQLLVIRNLDLLDLKGYDDLTFGRFRMRT